MDARSLSSPLALVLAAAVCAVGCRGNEEPSPAPSTPAERITASAIVPEGRRDAAGASAPDAPANELEVALAAARARFEADPSDEDAIIWYGRRLAYLGRFLEAEQIYSRGLEQHPASYRLRRHRGHRLISMRRFEEASRDLAQAARLIEGVPDAIEPDGMPNEHGIPRSTTHSNIHYHLGLAWYLQGQFELAERAWAKGLEVSRVNDDMLCATSYWLYLARRRLGDEDGAALLLEPIRAEMEILENHAYHDLLRFFRDEVTEGEVLGAAEPGGVDHATRAYGIGARYLIEGDRTRALELFERVGGSHNAFGYIAAEAELRRLR